MSNEIPQVVSITPVSSDGLINLGKEVSKQLGMDGTRKLYLRLGKEIQLSTKVVTGRRLHIVDGNRARLPDDVLRKLGISKDERGKSLVGLVQRRDALAVKRFEVVEEEGEIADLYDIETPLRIRRVAKTNPMPEKALPSLRKKYKGLSLQHDVRNYLKGRRTFEVWKARKLLGASEPSDEELRRELIRERLSRQLEDGSWEGKTTVTARILGELADLGMTRKEPEIKEAVRWLLARPQSSYNPGMFFAYDELVEEQRRIREKGTKKERCPKERFNQRRSREVNLVRDGDDLVRRPCGPRIMWTTALILGALLKLGYEGNERVKTALRTLCTVRWCDNAQQYGVRRKEYSIDEIVREVEEGVQIFRRPYGGVEALEKADISHEVPFFTRRIRHSHTDEGSKYVLRLPDVGEGCPVMMTRALSHVKDEKLRRLAEARLWLLAQCQHSQDISYEGKATRKLYVDPQAMFLTVFASYPNPVSELQITRMLPWIIANQNEDGSWGEGATKDASTLAVISALRNIGFI